MPDPQIRIKQLQALAAGCPTEIPARVHKTHDNAKRFDKGERDRIANRNATLKRRKLSFEDYEALLSEQHNACAICKIPFRGKSPCIDHDHETGIVRGLLCNPCNRGIGLLSDSKHKLLEAANYIARHESLVLRVLEDLINKRKTE